jgi:hypothetical protein
MLISFYSILTFRNSIDAICRKERNGYHSCKKDICDLLKDRSFDEIWEMKHKVRDLDNIRVIKIRVQNSFQNLSSADGFRLIICCNKKYQAVTFLNIYPKRGKLGRLDQSKEEFKQQLKMYLSSFQSNQLVKHDINNDIREIEKDKSSI